MTGVQTCALPIYNSSGQTNVPNGLQNVKAVAAAGNSSLALLNDGTVVPWGYDYNAPIGLTNVAAIAGGGQHYLALRNDGTAGNYPFHTVRNNPVRRTGLPVFLRLFVCTA